jgi:hypothetical protein
VQRKCEKEQKASAATGNGWISCFSSNIVHKMAVRRQAACDCRIPLR